MKIAIMGTRGVPNNHGGFEQFAEYLSQFLVEQGHQVWVYNSNNHPYQKKTWNGVNIIHKYDPEDKIGTAGQFVYDLNCILNCRKSNYDIILQLGYTSSSIWGKLMPNSPIIITNMDGMEWQRSKYNKHVQKFLRYAESLAIKYSDYLISDSVGIQSYLEKKYNVYSEYIAYGANIFSEPKQSCLKEYNVIKYNYNLLIARLEPENNIETILDGVMQSEVEIPLLIVGKHETKFGEYLKTKYRANSQIIFLGAIYNLEHLNNLRYFSNLYFHGHSVGGTNPSLLEAMASNSLIVAHDNVFNRCILESDAFYFKNEQEVSKHINILKSQHLDLVENNKQKIISKYEWKSINKQYEIFFKKCLKG